MNRDKQTNSGRYHISDMPRARGGILDVIHIVSRPVPAAPIFLDVDMTWAENLRKEYEKRGCKITMTALILKAIGIAQVDHPFSRTVMLPWGATMTLNEIVAGFTVERYIDGIPGVFLGTVRDPHTKSLEQIGDELKAFGSKSMEEVADLEVQNRFSKFPLFLRRMIIWVGMHFPGIRLKYMGATFGVSSLGKYGITTLVPPCITTSIFGVGCVEDRAVVRNSEIVIRPMMTLSLNFDHRAIDGAPAARFLAEVKTLLEGGLAKHMGVASENMVTVAPASVPTNTVP
ncbi:MAG: 2-oxo acid dehydrogenase subunit E2 [Candidatus Obscuribacterales bacterium]|nr:2-oxo acid dehydrogenase subunit E2 [Candidatus Obscuribacterales bacterium]